MPTEERLAAIGRRIDELLARLYDLGDRAAALRGEPELGREADALRREVTHACATVDEAFEDTSATVSAYLDSVQAQLAQLRVAVEAAERIGNS